MDARHLALALLLPFSGCLARPQPAALPPLSAQQPQPEPERIARFYTVHFDHVQPDRLAQFVGARQEFLGVLAEHGTHDARGTFLQAGPSLFLTVKGFDAYGELDQRRAARDRALASVPNEAVERYDDQSDSALDAPHNTEVWTHLDDLDYRAPGPVLSPFTAPASRMIVSALRPMLGEPRCDDAWPRVHGALVAARYPLSRVTFYSSLGSGHVVSFWVAPTRELFATTPSPEDVVAEVLGRQTAAELDACLGANVIRRESIEVAPRPDLTGPLRSTAE